MHAMHLLRSVAIWPNFFFVFFLFLGFHPFIEDYSSELYKYKQSNMHEQEDTISQRILTKQNNY